DFVRVLRINDEFVEVVRRALSYLPGAPTVVCQLHAAAAEASLKGVHERKTRSLSGAGNDEVTARVGAERGDVAVAGCVEYARLEFARDGKDHGEKGHQNAYHQVIIADSDNSLRRGAVCQT